jgi:hypothetical protein
MMMRFVYALPWIALTFVIVFFVTDPIARHYAPPEKLPTAKEVFGQVWGLLVLSVGGPAPDEPLLVRQAKARGIDTSDGRRITSSTVTPRYLRPLVASEGKFEATTLRIENFRDKIAAASTSDTSGGNRG